MRKIQWWKLVTTWLIFLGLHFSYETFPNTLFKVIGEEGETTYFHMKMLFFAYIFASLIEFIISRKKISSPGNFSFTRMFIAVAYPWLTITVFFIAEALLGHMLEMPWELIFANVVTLWGIFFALGLEQVLERTEWHPVLKASILLLFLSAILTYVVFSFNTPEYFFSTPTGIGH